MSRSERKRKIREEVYAAKGITPGPYTPGTMEYNHWQRVARHYNNMEAAFDELAAAYGEFRPDRLQAGTNHVRT